MELFAYMFINVYIIVCFHKANGDVIELEAGKCELYSCLIR